MKQTLYILLCSLTISGIVSCGQTKKMSRGYKRLFKGGTVYMIPSLFDKNVIQEFKVKRKTRVKIEDKSSYLIITDIDVSDLEPAVEHTITKPIVRFPAEMQTQMSHFFPDGGYYQNGPNTLWYFDTKFFLQSLSIPIKVRPGLDVDVTRYKDTLSKQTETGLNIGVSVGYKLNWNFFSAKKNIFGQNTNRLSFAPGVLLSIGATDLKKYAVGYNISFEKKAPILTYGGVFVLGFNSINIGYAFGFDHLMSSQKKNWKYHDKVWHGVAIGIDILK